MQGDRHIVSGDMLRVARSKAASKTNPVFLKMDMRKIQLKDKYDIVVVLFGGFGRLLTRDDVGDSSWAPGRF